MALMLKGSFNSKMVNSLGRAVVDSEQGMPFPIQNTPRVVADALKVTQEGNNLTQWIDKLEKEFVFRLQAGKELTYANFYNHDLELTLKLINQYIVFGKIVRFT